MHLVQNAETIDRLVKQGGLLLKTYHAEYDKDPASFHAEFLRGRLRRLAQHGTHIVRRLRGRDY